MAFIGVDAEQTSKSHSAHNLSLSADPQCFRSRVAKTWKVNECEREEDREYMSFSECLILFGC